MLSRAPTLLLPSMRFVLRDQKVTNLLTVRTCHSFIQGQQQGNIKEHFYFIDDNGLLFVDGPGVVETVSNIKNKPFLKFFFGGIRHNNTGTTNSFG